MAVNEWKGHITSIGPRNFFSEKGILESKFGECRKYKKSWGCVLKNVVRIPTFAVDGHMTLMDPWRSKKSVSPDGGVKVSMTCGGEGMEGTCDINWAEELFVLKRVFWIQVWRMLEVEKKLGMRFEKCCADSDFCR